MRRPKGPSPSAPQSWSFAMTDVVRQYRDLVAEQESGGGFVHDALIAGGGAAGAGVLRDLASRGNASALLVDRGPFGGETSSKTGKAIHPGIRYFRMAFHRTLLAFHLRRDPKIKQTFAQNLRGAWLDLKLVWYGTRERKILIETTAGTVEEIPNIVFVLPDSPEKKWAVFLGISLYDLFTALWSWFGLVPRLSRVRLFGSRRALAEELPHMDAQDVLGGILYWDGKANNDKILVLKAIRDAYFRSTPQHPIRAMSHVEVVDYAWEQGGGAESGHFTVTLARRFEHDDLPETVIVRARTIANAAGPWLDEVRNRTAQPDGKRTVVYSRGTHLEVTNRFIHESLAADPRLRVGLVPLNEERQHYLRPFHQHGLWYIQLTTTDRAQPDPDLVVPVQDEFEELLECYNELVEDRWKVGREDIFNVFCGIRPLASGDGGEISVKDISRMFRITRRPVGAGVVFDMVNVKLTEFRWAGRAVGDQIAAQLRQQNGTRLGASATRRMPFLVVPGELRFAPQTADDAREDRGFLREKVRHYVLHQMAGDLQDYLLNSGGIRDVVVFDDAGRCTLDLEALDLVLDEMSERLGWDGRRRRAEWLKFTEVYCRNLAYADLGGLLRDREPAGASRATDTQA